MTTDYNKNARRLRNAVEPVGAVRGTATREVSAHADKLSLPPLAVQQAQDPDVITTVAGKYGMRSSARPASQPDEPPRLTNRG